MPGQWLHMIAAVAEQEQLNGPGVLLPALMWQLTITHISASQTLSPNFGQEDIVKACPCLPIWSTIPSAAPSVE